MKIRSKKVDTKYEIKYITIPVPKNLVMLTTVMAYDDEINGGISVNTISYGTKELKKLENSGKYECK